MILSESPLTISWHSLGGGAPWGSPRVVLAIFGFLELVGFGSAFQPANTQVETQIRVHLNGLAVERAQVETSKGCGAI